MSQITKEELGFPNAQDRLYQAYVDEMFRLTGKRQPTEDTNFLWIQVWLQIQEKIHQQQQELQIEQEVKGNEQ